MTKLKSMYNYTTNNYTIKSIQEPNEEETEIAIEDEMLRTFFKFVQICL